MAFTRLFAKEHFPAPRWAYLGRGLYLAWFTAVTITTPPLLPAYVNESTLIAQRMAFFALYLASCIAFTALWRRLSPLRSRHITVVGATAVGLAGVFVYLLVMWGALPQGAMMAGFVLAALALPLLDIGWGEAYSYLPLGSAAAMLSASVAVFIVLVAVTTLVPTACGAILLALQTCGSGLLLLLALARSPYRSYREPENGRVLDLQPSWRLLVGTFLFASAASLLSGASERVGGAAFVTWPGTLLAMALAVAFFVGITANPQKDPARFLTYLGLIEAVAYLAFGLSGPAYPVDRAAHTVIASCMACIGFITWFVAIDTAQVTKTSPYRACAIGLVAITAGKTAGEVAAVVDLQMWQLSLVALAITAFGIFFVATSKRPETVALPVENALETRAALLAERFGLTPREREVLVEWASGHNVAYVAETLSISVSTAKTHIAHISQKTSTHGREELLRLLDAVAGPNAG